MGAAIDVSSRTLRPARTVMPGNALVAILDVVARTGMAFGSEENDAGVVCVALKDVDFNFRTNRAQARRSASEAFPE